MTLSLASATSYSAYAWSESIATRSPTLNAAVHIVADRVDHAPPFMTELARAPSGS